MDGVGGSTRLSSRSSTRHGQPSSVFQGPVRKWRKSWSPITNTSANSSRVLLYKWTPISGNKDDTAEEQTSQATRYVPVSVIMAKHEKQVGSATDMEEEDKDTS